MVFPECAGATSLDCLSYPPPVPHGISSSRLPKTGYRL